MTLSRASLLVPLLSLIALASACGDLAAPVDPNAGGSTNGGNSASGSGSKAGSGTGGAGSKAGSGTGGKGSPGGGDADGGEAGANGGILSLTKVSAHVVGRNGDSVRFTVVGTQPNSGAYSIAVALTDDAGQGVDVFDNDFDGSFESADGRVAFDAPVTTDSFTITATMHHVDPEMAAKLATAKVSIVDGTDQLSEELEATIGQQTALKLNDACDPTNVKDRCDIGQSCSGVPSKCAAGVKPTLEEVKYLKTPFGPQILANGSDPDDDLGKLKIELLDLQNKPVIVDELATPTSVIDTDFTDGSTGGKFFLYSLATPPLEEKVPRVRVTAFDALSNQSNVMVANLASITRGANGAKCDPRGFSGCIADYVCSPGLPTVMSTCAKTSNVRIGACAAAPKLDPEKGVTVAAGQMDGVSLYDPPAGCVGPETTNRPEGLVSLHLRNDVPKLTISTKRPETTVDTHVYLIPACAADSSENLGCLDDDTLGVFATDLVLENVPAGDYTIVIEPRFQTGGGFGVSVSTN